MKKGNLFLLAMLLLIKSYAQESLSKRLFIGDTVPDISFNHVLNYKTTAAKLSDFKGKLVILDFWSTGCTSCIEYFPHMSALQKEFGDKIQILLVDAQISKWETLEKINGVIDRFKKRTGYKLDLPVPVFDTVLNTYFPHLSVPTEVLIDSKGTMIAITNATEITSENIAKILAGQDPDMAVKDDLGADSLVQAKGQVSKNFLYSSGFSGFDKYLPTTNAQLTNKAGESVGYTITNYPLWTLFQMSLSYEEHTICAEYSNTRLLIEANNLNIADIRNEPDKSNLFCYTVNYTPNTFKGDRFVNDFLRIDIERFFNVKVNTDTRKMKVLVFRSSDKLKLNQSKYSKEQTDLDGKTINKFLHKVAADRVSTIMEGVLQLPVINETAHTGSMDFDFPAGFNFKDKTAVRNFLKNAGFVITEEERTINVVLVTDKYKNN